MKRGISSLIAIALILILAVSAVSLLWISILPKIKINSESNLNIAEISISTEEGYTTYDYENKIACVQVKRGEDNSNLSGIKFIFSFNGNSISRVSYDVMGENGKKKYCFDFSEENVLNAPEKVSIAPIYKNNNNERVGEISSSTTTISPAIASEKKPSEICDGMDNNLDGVVDEGCLCEGDSFNYCSQIDNNKDLCLSSKCKIYETRCMASDINFDGVVNSTDKSLISDNFGKTGCNFSIWASGSGANSDWCERTDTDMDGVVNSADLSFIIMYESLFPIEECSVPFYNCYQNFCETSQTKSACESNSICKWKKPDCTKNEDCPGTSDGCYSGFCSNTKCSLVESENANCDYCNMHINQANSVIKLRNDLLNCDKYGVLVNARNVTVDCQGHKITGSKNMQTFNSKGQENCNLQFLNGDVYPAGIGLCRGTAMNAQIRNCIISDLPMPGYGGGIANWDEHLQQYNSTFENNHIINCPQAFIQWGRFDLIKNNTFENSSLRALFIDESSPNTYINNTFKNNKLSVDHFCGRYCKDFQDNFTENIFINNEKEFNLYNEFLLNNTILNTLNSKTYEIFGQSLNEKIKIENTTFNQKPVFYLKNIKGTAQNPVTYSDEIGFFFCTNCSFINLTNIKINEYSKYGIYLINSTNISVTGEIKNHNTGIYVWNSSYNNFNVVFSNNDKNIQNGAFSSNNLCSGSPCIYS